MRDPVIITSKQTHSVYEMRALGDNAVAAMRVIEDKVEDDFAQEARRAGVAIDGVEFHWVCVMQAHGVSDPEVRVVP